MNFGTTTAVISSSIFSFFDEYFILVQTVSLFPTVIGYKMNINTE